MLDTELNFYSIFVYTLLLKFRFSWTWYWLLVILVTLEVEGKGSFGDQDLAASLSSIVRTQLKTMKHEISSSLTQNYSQERMECKWWKFIDRRCKILIFFLNLVFAWTHTNLAKDLNVVCHWLFTMFFFNASRILQMYCLVWFYYSLSIQNDLNLPDNFIYLKGCI